MNRYFYVPVTNSSLSHDGASLASHLKVIDDELFRRGSVDTYNAKDAQQYQYIVETGEMYHERMLPDRIVIATDDCIFFYEISSEEPIQIESIESILPCEVSGLDVVDIFTDNPNYRCSVLNFFQAYAKAIDEENNSRGAQKGKIKSAKEKIKSKFQLARIFNRK